MNEKNVIENREELQLKVSQVIYFSSSFWSPTVQNPKMFSSSTYNASNPEEIKKNKINKVTLTIKIVVI